MVTLLPVWDLNSLDGLQGLSRPSTGFAVWFAPRRARVKNDLREFFWFIPLWKMLKIGVSAFNCWGISIENPTDETASFGEHRAPRSVLSPVESPAVAMGGGYGNEKGRLPHKGSESSSYRSPRRLSARQSSGSRNWNTPVMVGNGWWW